MGPGVERAGSGQEADAFDADLRSGTKDKNALPDLQKASNLQDASFS